MKKKYVYILVALISLATLAFTSIERINVENASNKVNLLLDYNEAKILADQSGETFKSWLELFRQSGFSSVAIEEESLKSLRDNDDRPIKYSTIKIIRQDYEELRKMPKSLSRIIESDSSDDYDLLVKTNSKSNFEFIIKGLKSRYTNIYKEFQKDGTYYILIDGKSSDVILVTQTAILDEKEEPTERAPEYLMSKLENMGLGFDEAKIAKAKASGLKPLLRPKNYDRMSGKLIDAFFSDAKKYDAIPDYIVFAGKSCLGFDADNYKDSGKMMEALKANNIAVGMIESGVQRQYVEQDGIDKLADMSEYNVVRVFPVVKYIQMRYQWLGYEGAEEIENTLYRAITERNIRSIYFRPFMKDQINYVTDKSEYRKSFEQLSERLGKHGITYGDATVYKPLQKSPLELTLLASGLVLAIVVTVGFIVGVSDILGVALLGVGIFLALVISFLKPSYAQTLFSFGSSVVFPTLSIAVMVEYLRNRLISNSVYKLGSTLKDGVLLLILCIAIVTIGGLYIGSFLGTARYIIEMDIFRGVKLSQALPPAIFLVIYFIKFGFGRSKEDLRNNKFFYFDIKKLLNVDIKLWYVIAAGVAGVIGLVYLARTGHETSIQPSTFELVFRNFLEYELFARPRSKEFLIAFPALVLLVYAVSRKLKFAIIPLGLLASIGFASVVNTFSHIRSPLVLSLSRTFYSTIFGLAIGILIILIMNFVVDNINARRGRRLNE